VKLVILLHMLVDPKFTRRIEKGEVHRQFPGKKGGGGFSSEITPSGGHIIYNSNSNNDLGKS
jgi:hypothetical protein